MITGDGADELIGGIIFLDKYYKYFSSLPNYLKHIISKFHFNNKRLKNFFDKASEKNNLFFRYLNWHSIFKYSNLPLKDKNKICFSELLSKNYISDKYNFKTEELLNIEFNLWLKEHYCLFVDKLSMAHSLELRFPFLDQNYLIF